jgi:sulfate permease, SulP family
MEANVEVDITALDAVEALRRELKTRGIVFALAGVKQDLLDQLKSFGLATSVGADHIFPTLPTAVAAYERWRGGQGRGRTVGSGRSARLLRTCRPASTAH